MGSSEAYHNAIHEVTVYSRIGVQFALTIYDSLIGCLTDNYGSYPQTTASMFLSLNPMPLGQGHIFALGFIWHIYLES
jgi:hypothetical protein